MKKLFSIILSLGITMSISGQGFATNTSKPITNNKKPVQNQNIKSNKKTPDTTSNHNKNVSINEVKVVLDGKRINFDSKKGTPFVEYNNVYLPVDQTMKNLGFIPVELFTNNSKKGIKGYNRKSTATSPNVTFMIKEDKSLFWQFTMTSSTITSKSKDGKVISYVKTKDKIDYLPADILLKNLGYNVNFDKKTNTLKVYEDNVYLTKEEEITKKLKGYMKDINTISLTIDGKKLKLYDLYIDSDIGKDFAVSEQKDALGVDVLYTNSTKLSNAIVGGITKDKKFVQLALFKDKDISLYPYKFYKEDMIQLAKENNYYNGSIENIQYIVMMFRHVDDDTTMTAVITPNPYNF